MAIDSSASTDQTSKKPQNINFYFMKPITIFYLLLFFLPLSLFSQNIINVDNSVGSIAEYTSLQDAIEAAGSEDLIYIHGSTSNYGDIVVNKKVTLIGPGYFLAANNGGINSLAPAIVTNLDLLEGSDNSVVMGLTLELVGESTSQDRALISNTSNVVFIKNMVKGNVRIETSANIVFRNNYTLKYKTLASFGGELEIREGSSNILVTNNCFSNSFTHSSNINISMDGNTNAKIYNNIFTSTIECDNSIIKNNIFLNGRNIEINNNSISSNLFSVPESDLIPNNSTTPNNSSICLGYPEQGFYTSDGRFALKPDSPAIGAGEGGVDCGVFAGDNSYILSGLPSIPIITELSAPSSAKIGETINVRIKASIK